MALLQIEKLAKSFGGDELFTEFTAVVNPGERVALVGDNGTGKSTLLAIIAGIEAPSSGRVRLARGTRIGYLPQVARLAGEETLYGAMQAPFSELIAMEREIRRLETQMAARDDPELLHRYDTLHEEFIRHGGYEIDARVREVLAGVGFTPEEFDRPVHELSGGEEARAALARVLVESPDLLLLDEPTNHLDFAALAWLEERLLEFPGALILVSHDRHLLGLVTNRTWEIGTGQVTIYRVGYTASRPLRAAAEEKALELYAHQQETIARYKDFIARHHAGQKHRQAKDREKKLAHLEQELIERPQAAKGIVLRIPLGTPSGKQVLRIENLTVGYDRSLFTVPAATVYRGDRVGVIGENGSGKTTLLKTIIGERPPLAGTITRGHGVRIAYFSQTQEGLHGDSTVLDALLSRFDLTIGEARGVLGRFRFVGDDVGKRLSALSGGERSRLALAILSLTAGNLLIFDEPTNHLDLRSQEILQRALLDYPGTIILVSHDRALLEATATTIWAIEGATLHVYPMSFAAYWTRHRTPRPTAEPVKKQAPPRPRPPNRDRYAARRRAEQIAAAETEIDRLETRLRELEAEIEAASNAGDTERIAALGADHRSLSQELQARMEEWERMIDAGTGD